MIKGDKFYFNNNEYQIEKRIGVYGEYVITTPNIYDFSFRSENDTPFYKPLFIIESRKESAMLKFEGKYQTIDSYNVLGHDEYYVITPIRKQKVYIGEHTTVKRFLGIPVWKSTVYDYEYI